MENKAKEEKNVPTDTTPILSIGEYLHSGEMIFSLCVSGNVSREYILGIMTDLRVQVVDPIFSTRGGNAYCVCRLKCSGVEYILDYTQPVPIAQGWLAKIRRNNFLGWTWIQESDRLVLQFFIKKEELNLLEQDKKEDSLEFFSRIKAIKFHSLSGLALAVELGSIELPKGQSQLWLNFGEKGEYNYGNG